jgi:hypothetical protein
MVSANRLLEPFSNAPVRTRVLLKPEKLIAAEQRDVAGDVHAVGAAAAHGASARA